MCWTRALRYDPGDACSARTPCPLQAILSTNLKLTHNILNTDMKDTRYENALLEHFFYQMSLFTSVSWFYYGDAASNSFIGLRRSWPCETNQTCAYAGATVNPSRPALPEGSIVRLLTKAGRLEAYSTSAGSDPAVLLYSEAYDLKVRPWYTGALGGTAGQNAWTDPYPFTGGVLGVTVSRLVKNSAGTTLGVLAADYELTFLTDMLAELALTTAGNASDARLFVIDTATHLLASSTAPQGADITLLADTTDPLIRSIGTAAVTQHPAFTNSTADWIALATTASQGTATADGERYVYDAIGLPGPRWVVVVSSAEDGALRKVDIPPSGCLSDGACRSAVLAAHQDYRLCAITLFTRHTRVYLGAALAAITSLDTAYNMGNLHDGWCTTCGTLFWNNTAQRTLLQDALRSAMLVYTELSWLYFGFDGGEVIGYRRSEEPDSDTLHLWHTCSPDTGCTGGTGFWEGDNAGGAPLSHDPEFDVSQKAWFRLPGQLGMSGDSVAWTQPYPFVDGSTGVSLVKRAYDGDFFLTGSMGVWGADYTVSHLSAMLHRFGVGASVYLMDVGTGSLLAYPGAAPAPGGTAQGLPKAEESRDTAVAESARLVLEGLAGQGVESGGGMMSALLHLSNGTRCFVEASFLRDADPAVIQSYAWVLVLVTAEDSLYTPLAGTAEPPDDSFPKGVAIALILCGIAFVVMLMATCACFTAHSPPPAQRKSERKYAEEKREMTDISTAVTPPTS